MTRRARSLRAGFQIEICSIRSVNTDSCIVGMGDMPYWDICQPAPEVCGKQNETIWASSTTASSMVSTILVGSTAVHS
jgi:hypothetical protein